MLALGFDSWNRSQFQEPQGIDFAHPYVDIIIITTNLGSHIFLKKSEISKWHVAMTKWSI